MIAPLPDKESTIRPRVFISHSHKDQVCVHKIVSWLEKTGFEPWASFEECQDKYRVEIDRALLSCDIFLLVASKNAFASIEVRRELNTAGSASINKPIAYYKLDGANPPEGYVSILSEKQYIEASRVNLELASLAEYLFETWDGNINEDVRRQRAELIQRCSAIEEANLMKWRDKLWNLKLDANNSPRKLSSADRSILQSEADRLGIIVSIDDEDKAFTFNKTLFQRDLIGIIAKRRIDVSMANQIETKRIECSVSKDLAVTILKKRLEKIDYLNQLSFSKSAGKLDHWLVSEIKKAQGKRLGASAKEKPRGNSFSFTQLICPLEYYKNGACELKMDVMSLQLSEGSIRFQGLQGRKPFSFSTSTSVVDIATYANSLIFNLDGHETRVVLRLDPQSADYSNLLSSLRSATELPVRIEDFNHNLINSLDTATEKADPTPSKTAFAQDIKHSGILRQESSLRNSDHQSTSSGQVSGADAEPCPTRNSSSADNAKQRQGINHSNELSQIEDMCPANNETIIVNQVYLGAFISSIELHHMQRTPSGIVFEGIPTNQPGLVSLKIIRSFRKLVRVEVFPDEIRLHEDGHETYISIMINKEMKTYFRIVDYLKCLGFPAVFRGHQASRGEAKTPNFSESPSAPIANDKQLQSIKAQDQEYAPKADPLCSKTALDQEIRPSANFHQASPLDNSGHKSNSSGQTSDPFDLASAIAIAIVAIPAVLLCYLLSFPTKAAFSLVFFIIKKGLGMH